MKLLLLLALLSAPALAEKDPEVALDELRIKTETLRDTAKGSFGTLCSRSNIDVAMCQGAVEEVYKTAYRYGYMRATVDRLQNKPIRP